MVGIPIGFHQNDPSPRPGAGKSRHIPVPCLRSPSHPAPGVDRGLIEYEPRRLAYTGARVSFGQTETVGCIVYLRSDRPIRLQLRSRGEVQQCVGRQLSRVGNIGVTSEQCEARFNAPSPLGKDHGQHCPQVQVWHADQVIPARIVCVRGATDQLGEPEVPVA